MKILLSCQNNASAIKLGACEIGIGIKWVKCTGKYGNLITVLPKKVLVICPLL